MPARGLTLKTKALVLGAMVVLIVLVLIGLSYYSDGVHRHLGKLTREVQTLHMLTLENRRREKDFLLRFDLEYQDKVHSQTRDIVNRVRTLRELGLDDEGKAFLDRIEEGTDSYVSLFDQVVSLYFKRGLNEVSGLRGELREAVHRVERILPQYPDAALTSQMLTMRRREKDYLLRGENRYIEALERDHAAFIDMLARSDIPVEDAGRIRELLSSYVEAVRGIQRVDGDIDSKIQEFRGVVHRIEADFGQFLVLLDARRMAAESRLDRILFVVSGVSLVLVIVYLYFDLVTSSMSLGRVRSLLQQAAGGHLGDRFSGEDGNQGDLAALGADVNRLLEVFNEYHAHLRALALGGVAPNGAALPAEFEEVVGRLRVRLSELETLVGQDESSVASVSGTAASAELALASNTVDILARLCRSGLALSHRLEHGTVLERCDAQDVAPSLKELEVVGRGVMEQARLLAELLGSRESAADASDGRGDV